MLKFISCFSDGILLQDQCNVINVDHGESPQTTEAPFQVDWIPEWNGTSTVTLSAKSGQFKGFMLDFRNCDGSFSLVPQDSSRLLCGGRVMTQSNNLGKTSVRGLWTSKAAEECLFRVAFVETYFKFWEKQITVQPTTPPPTGMPTTPLTPEASSTQTNPTSRGMSTTPLTSEASSTQTNPTTRVVVTPPSPPQCVQYMRCIIALLLFSRLCFLGGSSLLIIIRPDLKKMATMSASVLELVSKTIAVILIVIKAIKYQCMYECPGLRIVFTALTVTSMASSLLRTIIIFLHCGPSHELRKCWLYSIIMVDLMNTIVTTTALFFGTWCFEERWLPILLGVYVVLEIMLYLGSVFFEKMEKYQIRKKVGNQNHIQEKRISQWLLMFLIFTIFNVMLAVALMTGVSLVAMIN